MKGTLDILIEAQLEAFAQNYLGASRQVFYDEASGKLMHPGEFGGLREGLVRELLRNFLPESYGISEGFVVSPSGDISSQCDIIIYSRIHAPVIQPAERQRFFPIESIVAVGEVKSVVDSVVLRDALEKLARVKEIRANLTAGAVARSVFNDVGVYDPFNLLLDQIGTFIIAESISCQRSTVGRLIREASDGKHPTMQANLVASVRDYCTAYKDQRSTYWLYPVDVDEQRKVIATPLPLVFLAPAPGGLQHLKLFLRHLELIVNRTTVLHPEFSGYFGFGDLSDCENCRWSRTTQGLNRMADAARLGPETLCDLIEGTHMTETYRK